MSEMASPRRVFLSDYRPPSFLTERVELAFALDPEATIVTARQELRRNPAARPEDRDLVLYGDELELLALSVDGRPLAPAEYRIDGETMRIPGLPDACTLAVTTRIRPAANTKLMGLYRSSGILCTQCEAEGFRRITWYQDRPDVMARFRVRLEADRARYPALLSNGNPVGAGELAGGRHYAVWDDPFPKPSYLFAIVAGDLACLEDRFTTRSGRSVTLRIWADAAHVDQCGHAMESLKKAMRWDEEVYGLEYDLDLFQIVVVNDFNFGAMENKGLNIFNASAALARRDLATDADFQSVERIIAHEYFHNWTGNRITCRDWFQLTLKEGLTVFRDQQFAADMHSAAVKRIGDVVHLREVQFAEDAGPLAHPIRPDSYAEINNFYTSTVYNKGAEVIRMLHTTVGPERWRKGMDTYIARHDGQAVTCEDFVAAIGDGAGEDLSRFLLWYRQAGTPTVKVTRAWDPARGALTLEVAQEVPPTPGQPVKLPMPIPIKMGLVGKASGRPLPLRLEGENAPGPEERILELATARASWTFVGLEEEPVPSLLRSFSAPVRLELALSAEELGLLLARDPDPFCRWDAGQTLATRLLLEAIAAWRERGTGEPDDRLVAAWRGTLADEALDPAVRARLAQLPGRSYLTQQMAVIEVDPLFAVTRGWREGLGRALRPLWRALHERHRSLDPEAIDTLTIGRRALKNTALGYLVAAFDAEAEALALAQYRTAGNMTDRMAALRALADSPSAEREAVLEDFYARYREEPLVVDKWFALQAGIEDAQAVERVERLLAHPAFTMTNPNRVRALLGSFAAGNLVGFHRADGAGYRLVMDRVIALDRINPQVAARLATSFGRWRRYEPSRRELMRAELERLAATPGLSKDCADIASRALGG
ncbi:MAG: aminopeptidase N [Geminicoccaceae bacterium]|nr:aminopeptidase N [Geminicoccaceae bacterium]